MQLLEFLHTNVDIFLRSKPQEQLNIGYDGILGYGNFRLDRAALLVDFFSVFLIETVVL